MSATSFKAAGLALAATFVTLTGTLAATGAPAHAAGLTATVAYRDLNLAAPSDQRALAKRVSKAANRLCVDPNEQSLSIKLARKVCVERAIASTTTQVARAIEQHRDAQTAALAERAKP